MCGIAGIVGRPGAPAVDPERLRRMRDVLRHRGPDDAGLWTDGTVGLAHRRLAIVDVAGGHQPMGTADGEVWVTFNGEIYNHAALRPDLEARGHRYQTRSDTETILHLYEEMGERGVERLGGMFAFALWDRRRRRLLLARDRLGIKPLYYAWTDTGLYFGSEIKAILAGLPSRPAFNEAVLPEFLATGFVAGEETFFRGIRKLLPGRTLSWTPGEAPAMRRYWHLPDAIDETPVTWATRARDVRERLAAAVQSHLMADVPLGLFLSGGIDSSGLAALMARTVTGPLRTFSVAFDEPGASELPFARMAARAAGAEHHEVVVSPAEFFAAVPRLVWHEDEPIAFPSSVPLYFVSRLAREHVKVVLTGEGADELFLGYNRYRVAAWNERLGRAYWGLVPGALRRGARGLLGRLPGALGRHAGRTFLAREPGARDLFCESFAVFPEHLRRALVRDPGLLDARDPHGEALRCWAAAPGESLTRMSHADLQTYLVELLMKQDQMSMAASVESRVPFLDHELVEHVAAMPEAAKLRGWQTKAVLRSALRDLVPPPIRTRRKMGFPVPVGRWLREGFRPLVDELILGARARERGWLEPGAVRRLVDEHAATGVHAQRLWLLLTLEVWQRMHVDGEDPADVLREGSLRDFRAGDAGFPRIASVPAASHTGARGAPWTSCG